MALVRTLVDICADDAAEALESLGDALAEADGCAAARHVDALQHLESAVRAIGAGTDPTDALVAALAAVRRRK